MASPVRIGRTVRAATITVLLAAFAVLSGCLHGSGEPDPLVFTGPSAPVPLWGPLPAFAFSPQEPIPGEVVAFDASFSSIGPGHTIASYAWLFGDGSGSPASPVATTTHPYVTEGEYTVSLTVTDNLGTAVTQEQQVLVNRQSPPIASIVCSVVGMTVNCDGTTSLAFAGRTIDPLTGYTWNFGDGTAAVADTTVTISHTYLASATFNVTLTVKDSAALTGSTSTAVIIP